MKLLLLTTLLAATAACASGAAVRCYMEAYCYGDTWRVTDYDNGALPDTKATHFESGECKLMNTDFYKCHFDAWATEGIDRDMELRDSTGIQGHMQSDFPNSKCVFNLLDDSTTDLVPGYVITGTSGTCVVMVTKQTFIA